MVDSWFTKSSIAASGDFTSPESLSLSRERTLTITAQMDFHASGTTDARVEVLYSPDNTNWDTIDFINEEFVITVSAGATVQRTVQIDVPEHGYVKLRVVNGDSAQEISNIIVWVITQSWKNRSDNN